MKVVVNTPAELIARHRPVVLPLVVGLLTLATAVQATSRYGSLAVGDAVGYVLGLATGVVIFVLVSGGSEVRFDAASGEVGWRRRVFLSTMQGKTPLASITGVAVVTDRHSDAGAQRVVVSTSDGPLPLTWHYSGIEPHEETAKAVRVWLKEHGYEV